jgi:hypothetical protein
MAISIDLDQSSRLENDVLLAQRKAWLGILGKKTHISAT